MFQVVLRLISRLIVLVTCLLTALPARAEQVAISQVCERQLSTQMNSD